MVWYQALPLESVRASSGWLSQLSPWLGSAFLLQVLLLMGWQAWFMIVPLGAGWIPGID